MTRLRNYLMAGIATIIPIWLTWIVFRFILRQLSEIGMPWVEPLAAIIAPYSPGLESVMVQPWFRQAVAIALTLVSILLLGWLASRVIGSRIITAFDRLVNRIPLVQTIYGSAKALISVLNQKPDQVQRVVLINFPSDSMRAVGFVTRTLTDSVSNRTLAAVYVPTTPVPTSGYMELVPWDELISTDWSVEEAMTFIISGGTVSPDSVPYHAIPPTEDRPPRPPQNSN
jgi:uncharacterized membrane protein